MTKNKLVKKRIFAIEDDTDHLLVITNMLTCYGATFDYVKWNAPHLTSLMIHCPPIDLILLDLMFPSGVTGYDLFTTIRAHPLLRSISVVAVSALDPSVEIPKAKGLGFAGFIAKPIVFEEFPNQLVDVLDGRQVWIS